MSISSWDLLIISGLLADGACYEKVIPSATELLSAGRRDNDIPRTCSFLFTAFHRQCHDVHRTVQLPASEWIHFWLWRWQIYAPPSSRDNKKQVKAQTKTSCPSGLIALCTVRTQEWEGSFCNAQHSWGFDHRNLPCDPHFLLVVLLCATNWRSVPYLCRFICSCKKTYWRGMSKTSISCLGQHSLGVEQNFYGLEPE